MSGERAQPLPLRDATTGEPRHFTPTRLVVAGYTASDQAAVAAHIAELAEIGVPPPATVPAFYDLDPALLTCAPVVAVAGAATSGEVEPVVLRRAGTYYLGVGSDHTDREREREDIAESKAVCPKPLGETVWEIGPDLSALPWAELAAESTADGVTYQRGTAGSLLHPADTARRMTDALGAIPGDLVMYCGTFPLLDGGFRYARQWRMALTLPDGTELTHAYTTQQLSQQSQQSQQRSA